MLLKMEGKVHKIFNVEAPDGSMIKVIWYPRYLHGENLKDNKGKSFDYRFDHFEFYGLAISETGYYSHFVEVELHYNPTDEEVIRFAKSFIEEKMGVKYGEPVQAKLL